MTDLRYPIGKLQRKPDLTDSERGILINYIEETPKNIRAAVRGLNDEQLNTPYRPDGWTVRQVVHHVPDSHMNAYIRFKLALTEDQPAIKTYQEQRWAELHDACTAPIEPSLLLLENLHYRWVLFLRSLNSSDFKKTYLHPESGVQQLDDLVQIYGWHGRHHTAHITSLRERMGWKL